MGFLYVYVCACMSGHVHVSLHVYMLLMFFLCFSICLFACLSSKERKRKAVWCWVGREERAWEEVVCGRKGRPSLQAVLERGSGRRWWKGNCG